MNARGRDFDWNAVRTRLESARLALERSGAPDPAAQTEIWRRRAQRLAERTEADRAPTEVVTLLTFDVAGERYGIALADLSQVAPCRGWTPVPGTSGALLGLMNLRGAICPLANLRRLLDLEDEERKPPAYVVVLREGERELGLAVDELDRVLPVPVASIGHTEDGATGLPRRYLAGIAPGILILDAPSLRAHPVFQRGPMRDSNAEGRARAHGEAVE